MTTIGTNPWLLCPKRNPQADLRLFCFPYAGAGASVFRTWSDELPSNIELYSIRLPGRESRIKEPPTTELSPLIQTLVQILLPYLDLPFAFFGHSMGTLLCFELARQLRRQNSLTPLHLFVSGRRAPQILNPNPSTYNLPDTAFIEELRRYNGTPEAVLQSTELMQLFLPVLRADLTIDEAYVYTPEAPLDLPISAFGGLQDSRTNYDDLAAWRDQTTSTFSLKMFSGDHFFLKTEYYTILQIIFRELTK